MIKIYLYPKEIFVSNKPAEVTTVLGSCISICLYDCIKKVGGINHFMLPFSKSNPGKKGGEYGSFAIPELIKGMLKYDCTFENLKANIYGGYSTKEGTDHFSVGQQNIDFAIKSLKQHAIQIKTRDVGGCLPRKISFNTYTGDVQLTLIPGLNL